MNQNTLIHFLEHSDHTEPLPDQMGTREIQILKLPYQSFSSFHSYDFFETVYVLKGTCQLQMQQQTLSLITGDLCVLSPALSHSLKSDHSSIVLLIRTSTRAMENLYSTAMHMRMNRIDSLTEFFRGSLYQDGYTSYLHVQTAEDPEIRSQVLDLFQEEFLSADYMDCMLSHMLSILFIKVMRKYRKMVQTPPLLAASHTEANYIYQYIRENYATASLNDLAKRLSYSVPYCSKYVRQCTGQGFSDLLHQIRFQVAGEYLQYSDLTIDRISERIGYANPENFMRMFKKTYGLSPTQYRYIHGQTAGSSANLTPP